MANPTRKILVGTASWSDPGFVEKWYPKRLPASQRLSWYSDHFNLVELNSSFYAIPARDQVRNWCRQTPDGFVFDVKMHRLLSRHSTKAETLPPDLRAKARVQQGKVQLTPELEKAVAKRFLEEIAPFREADKLGALLLQLSPSFRPKTGTLSDLDALIEVLQGTLLAVELRNRDWVEGPQSNDTLEFFESRRITLVSVDAPSDNHFMVMPAANYITNPKLGYLRLHGRNAAGYVKGRTVAERFDYLYSREETKQVAQRAIEMVRRADPLHVIYNNNNLDYAPRNAADLRKVLERIPDISTGPVASHTENMELKL